MPDRSIALRLALALALAAATAVAIGIPQPWPDAMTATEPSGLWLVLAVAGLSCWAAVVGLAASAAGDWMRGRRPARHTQRGATRRALLAAAVGGLVLGAAVVHAADGYRVCCGGTQSVQEATRLAH